MLVLLVIFISGCGSSKQQISQENPKVEKAAHELKAKANSEVSEAKVTAGKPFSISEEKTIVVPETKENTVETKIPSPVLDVPAKVDVPSVVKESSPLVAGDTRWILVFKTNELIEPQEREDILKALKEKWLKDKPHQEIAAQDFDMEKLLGRVVVSAEARRAYGKYEFTIRTGKMIQDGKDIVEEPISKEQGPDCIIDNRDSIENLLKEIKFAQ